MNKQKTMQTHDVIANKITFQELALHDFPVNAVGFSICIRALRQNWRQGTVACKTRSEVARSNKKPWKQKGTGRARAGSSRSPLWKGGGVIFGPQPRTRVLDITKKVKRRALGDLLRSFLSDNRIISLDWQATHEIRPKTSAAYKALVAAQISDKKINLFITLDDFLSQASFANIPSVRLMLFDQANALDLANCDYWVFLKKDFDAFKEMVSKWI